MGEIADAMINGELCEQCGVYLGPGEGYPRLCDSCAQDAQVDAITRERKARKVICPKCKKRVKEAWLADHMRDVHKITKE